MTQKEQQVPGWVLAAIGLMVLYGVMSPVFVMFSARQNELGFAKRCLQTRGVVSRYVAQRNSKGHDTSFIEYTFEVDGKSYKNTFNGVPLPAQGSTLTVWYDPANPQVNQTASPETLSNITLAGAVLMPCTVVIGLLVLRHVRFRRRQREQADRPEA